jgi:translation initiation factor 4A
MNTDNSNDIIQSTPTTTSANPACSFTDNNFADTPSDTGEIPITQKVITNWDDLDIDIKLLRGIYNMGFEKPSPIQQKAIKPIIDGKDIIAQARSGTGKTGSFVVGVISRIDINNKKIQAIIMSPTHELAHQIAKVCTDIGNCMGGLVVQTLIGGTSIQDDGEELRKNTPHIIVGTPGRIYDMIRRNMLQTSHIKILVLDEADDMLSTGFKDQIYNIFQFLPEHVQVALFSATMPVEILELTKKFMRDPYKIMVNAEELTIECIQQYYIALPSDHAKYDTLKQLFEYISLSQCIIYVNSVKRVVDLYNAMTEEGFSVCCIHSSMTKPERNDAFKAFKCGQHRVLISSNITARGIDIQQVSMVINFDIPKCVHTYLHRIGRSGRWGRKGAAINFVTRYDVQHMKNIESHYNISVQELPITNMQSIIQG